MPSPHTRMIGPSVLCVTLAIAVGCAGSTRLGVLESCRVEGLDEELSCGSVRVPENRRDPGGRAIDLKVVVVPARDPTDGVPVFVLEGGPGVAASHLAPTLARSPLREHHDLVLVDQRGTGGSNPLRCDAEGLPNLLVLLFAGGPGELAACRDRLDADLTQYTAHVAMQDLDDVRAALGHEQIQLWGASYGSLEALEYMRRHPARVRAAVLQGVAPPDRFSTLATPRAAQRALDATFAACAEQPDCLAIYRDLPGQLDAVLQRLSGEPAAVTVRDPASGQTVTVTCTRDLVAGILRFMLYDTRLAARIPASIVAADAGDYAPLLRFGARFARQVGGLFHFGASLSALCSEDLHRFSEAQVRDAGEGTFLGPDPILRLRRTCEDWPQGQLPDDFFEPVSFDGPVLLLSGALDPVTPVEWAESAARHLPDSRHVVFPRAGHFLGAPDCAYHLMARFFETGDHRGLDTSCAATVQRPPFAKRP